MGFDPQFLPAQPESVPQALASARAGGYGDLLKAIQGTNAEELNRLSTIASLPVSTGVPGTIPSAMTRPVTPYQEQALDRRQMVGKGAARMQGISNLIATTGNVVGRAVTEEKQQKQAKLVDTTTKLFTTQQTLNQAQQMKESATQMIATLDKSDPRQAQYQEMIKKADAQIEQDKGVINGIVGDPKMRKALAKGLDINYIDPSENKTEEHEAVRKAIQNVQGFQAKREAAEKAKQEWMAKQNPAGAQSFSDAFMKAQPQALAPNTLAQQQLAYAQARQKNSLELYKTVAPALIKASSASRVESMRGIVELQKQQSQLTHDDAKSRDEYDRRVKLMGDAQRFAMKKLHTENELTIGREQQRLKDVGSDPRTVEREAGTSDRTWASAIASQQTAYDTALALYQNTVATKGKDSKDTVAAQAELDARKNALESTKRHASYYKNYYNLLRKTLGLGELKEPEERNEADADSTRQSADTGSGLPDSLAGFATDSWGVAP